MSNPLDPVAFDKAVGPYRKRQKLMAELKEVDVGKDRRAQFVKESAQLDAEWVGALVGLRKIMDECSVLRDKITLNACGLSPRAVNSVLIFAPVRLLLSSKQDCTSRTGRVKWMTNNCVISGSSGKPEKS